SPEECSFPDDDMDPGQVPSSQVRCAPRLFDQASDTRSRESARLVLADRAYQGAGATVRTPYYRHREQPAQYQQYNRDHARLRAPGERAFAQLKTWKLFRAARCSPRRISKLIAATPTLLTCENSG
ncbi:transposase family protein, partial [Actinacidiphila acididurans]|uniref:transposase family protein n=1 Tax=Actinacidiphila acididurans TaxID=2784346 RepID=UPI0027DEAB7D